MLKMALRQSEKRNDRNRQQREDKGFFGMSKKRRRIWLMMRKKAIDEADIPGKAKKRLGYLQRAGLVSNQKTIQKFF